VSWVALWCVYAGVIRCRLQCSKVYYRYTGSCPQFVKRKWDKEMGCAIDFVVVKEGTGEWASRLARSESSVYHYKFSGDAESWRFASGEHRLWTCMNMMRACPLGPITRLRVKSPLTQSPHPHEQQHVPIYVFLHWPIKLVICHHSASNHLQT
jgi:hypothetical protein